MSRQFAAVLARGTRCWWKLHDVRHAGENPRATMEFIKEGKQLSYRGLCRIFALGLVYATTLGAQAAAAETVFPTKPVRMIVAFPPGQATDIVARMLAEELTKVWKRQVY